MNTPKKPEPTDEEILALAQTWGIDVERLRFIDERSDDSEGAAATRDTAALVAEYSQLTDVRLRASTEAANGLYIAESSKIINRALAAHHTPRSFFMTRLWFPRLVETLSSTWRRDAPILIGSDARIEGITGFHLHRGALASMERPDPVPVAEAVAGARRVVVVEDVVDHTNVGAIFRSAAGLGVDAVLLSPECADPLYRRSIRVSMGTVFQVPWARFTRWPHGLGELRETGFTVAALALEEDSVPLKEFAAGAPEQVALVMGTEGDGLRRATIDAADATVLIPMAHGVDSLNVAAATAVACYALQIDE
ncbi:MAG: TrmH family RNA methyltransferase [Brevibacterium yomogidense]|uniref:TrmH family RNA methyltransferase n=1 Tax=Brevibacterium sp. Mu109 TaxID=1255669 RepID=UPI000C59FE76|nr:RNA methyltransferase [Brevibacterium sp. Mu109]SMX67385.1 tRNA G18 (ribose-2'-O)-methylase SpoU [Brevibacterium sp. Mu109]